MINAERLLKPQPTCLRLARRARELTETQRESQTQFRRVISSLMVTLVAAGLCSARGTPNQKREKIRKVADETLNQLYEFKRHRS
jgi:hypothetical protein